MTRPLRLTRDDRMRAAVRRAILRRAWDRALDRLPSTIGQHWLNEARVGLLPPPSYMRDFLLRLVDRGIERVTLLPRGRV